MSTGRAQAAGGVLCAATGVGMGEPTVASTGVATGGGVATGSWTAAVSIGPGVRLSAGLVALQRVLEAAQALAHRFTHLGQALGAEDHQDHDQDECDVQWVVESDHY